MKVIIDRDCGHYWIEPLGEREDWMDNEYWEWRTSKAVEITEEEFAEYEKYRIEYTKWQVKIRELASTVP